MTTRIMSSFVNCATLHSRRGVAIFFAVVIHVMSLACSSLCLVGKRRAGWMPGGMIAPNAMKARKAIQTNANHVDLGKQVKDVVV